MSFHETRFPTGISRGASGGPERRTQIVTLGSGHEQRNQQWANARRRYDAGYGVRSADDVDAILQFFEERRGRAYGFRWKDWSDFKSCPPSQTPSSGDQRIGTGDGAATAFPLRKKYGDLYLPHWRMIAKPVSGTIKVRVAGADQTEGADFSVDATTGVVTFASPPADGAAIRAGFEFDVPARFDVDTLTVTLRQANAAGVEAVPIVEILL